MTRTTWRRALARTCVSTTRPRCAAATGCSSPLPRTTACDLNGSKPGCIRRAINQEITYPGRQTPYSHQASVGVQRQITTDSSLEVNYVYTRGRGEEIDTNANLSYNPATGANYPFTDISHRPFPDWG